MSYEACAIGCAGYSYFGVEYADECYCGNTIQSPGARAPDGSVGCNMACNGNAAEMCGGSNRMNFFAAAGVTVTTATTSTGSSTATSASSTTAASGPTSLPNGWASQGCWVDNAHGRIMANQQTDSNTLTIESCVAICSGLNYTVAGMEYSTQCFCDNHLINAATQAAIGDCAMTCSGNTNEKCGGPDRMTVYSTGGAPAVLPVAVIQKTGLPGTWQYQGCIADNFTQGGTFKYEVILPANDAQNCLTLCTAYGFMAAGLEYGNQCFCGDVSEVEAANVLGTPYADSACNAICPGNGLYQCGGGGTIAYYTSQDGPVWNYASGTAAGKYDFFMPGVVIPLITAVNVNGKVTFIEKHGSGPPNTTGAYELDTTLAPDFSKAWREMHVVTDVFCSAALILPDRLGRQINIGGWSLDSTFGIRLYAPSGGPGVNGTTDWQEDGAELQLQQGRWYPSATILRNGSILVVGGENGSNGPPVPTIEILPRIAGGNTTKYMDWLQRTDPENLYPFLAILPSGNIFVAYYNEARILNPVTFETITMLPNIPGHVVQTTGGRTYPLEGTMVILPQTPPYTSMGILICGGATQEQTALDNCVSIYPESTNPVWVLERMPSKRVMTCMTGLPDGTYLITNGAQEGNAGFRLGRYPNLNAILYNPYADVNKRFTVLANTTIARMYHSESILLPDGRILVSGSDPENLPGDPEIDPQEYRIETFTPSYLLSNAVRPAYTVNNRDWVYGSTYSITITAASYANLRISMTGMDASTHGNSMGQRTIFPAFTCNGGTCTVTAPSIQATPPGWFQLWVLDGPTPSHSQFIRLGGDPGFLGNWPQLPDFIQPGMGGIVQ
jgi:hypothetical protein